MAVNPNTPVELTNCPMYVPPLPPVYGTLILTLLEVTPSIKVPLSVALVQLREVILPTGGITLHVSRQFCPPMFNAKLAVPVETGVPVMV